MISALGEGIMTIADGPEMPSINDFLPDPFVFQGTPFAINRIIHAYRQKAQDELLSEDDSLRHEVRKSDYQRLASKRGTMTENNQQELLDALLTY